MTHKSLSDSNFFKNFWISATQCCQSESKVITYFTFQNLRIYSKPVSKAAPAHLFVEWFTKDIFQEKLSKISFVPSVEPSFTTRILL